MPKKFKKTSKFSFFDRLSTLQLLVFAVIFASVAGLFIWRSFAATNRIAVNRPAVAIMSAGSNSKYWIVTDDGGIFSEGGATFYGSAGGTALHEPITSAAVRPQHDGYWLLGGDGGVFAYGGAKYFGHPPIVNSATQYKSIVATPDGAGYWVIYFNGFIASYGSATTYSKTSHNGHPSINTSLSKTNTAGFGSIPGLPSGGIVGADRSASGYGLALVASNGAVYTYGDMPYHGGANNSSGITGSSAAASIIVNSSNGYSIMAKDGAVYDYSASYYGGANSLPLNGQIVDSAFTPDGKGYWLLGQDGGIFSYGDAQFGGNVNAPTIVKCWNNTTVLSTQSCPPKLTCWNGSFVTDLNQCPPKPAPVYRGGSSGSGSGNRSSGGGGSTALQNYQNGLVSVSCGYGSAPACPVYGSIPNDGNVSVSCGYGSAPACPPNGYVSVSCGYGGAPPCSSAANTFSSQPPGTIVILGPPWAYAK